MTVPMTNVTVVRYDCTND